MSLPQTEFRLSPYITVYPPENQGRTYKVNNSMTGKTFELGEQAVQVLRRFKSFNTFSSVLSESGLDEADLEKISGVLIRNKFLVASNTPEDYAISLSKTNSPLFGVLNNYILPPDGRTIDIIGVPFGKGNDIDYGTRAFPDVLRSKTTHLEFNPDGVQQVSFSFLDSRVDFENLKNHFRKGVVRDLGNIFFHFNETTDYCYEKIEAIAKSCFSGRVVPVFLGGDHSITYPVVKAAAAIYPSLKLLHFDAHLDTYYSKYDDLQHGKKISHNHSNFMRYCLDLENLSEVSHFGIRGISNRFPPRNDKQHIYWVEDIREMLRVPRAAVPEDTAMSAAHAVSEDPSFYYVTLDIDVLDPSCAMGTGSPAVNGLSLSELAGLLRIVLAGKKIIGLDLVEVNPSLDRNDLTIQCATYLLLHLLELIRI